MSEIIGAFLCAEIGNGATDPTPEARDRMLGRLAQMRLEFAEGQFDRVEVRRILRKINQRRARSFDGLRDAGNLVHRQIVHEHDLAAFEGRDEALLHVVGAIMCSTVSGLRPRKTAMRVMISRSPAVGCEVMLQPEAL